MKKILYVTNITRNVNAFFIPHINMLLENGYEVDCACKVSGEHEIKKDKFVKEIKFFDVPFTRTPIHYKNIVSLVKLIKIQKKENYDCIHVHSPIAGIYTRILKLIFPKVKMIYTAHGFHFYKGSSKLSWLVFGNMEKLFSRLTDILVTINEEDFEVAKTFHCKDVRKINGVGVDPSEFKELSDEEKMIKRKELGIKEIDKVFIMVGEHNKNKNQIMLLRCINEINEKFDNAKFIFIGDGEDLEKNRQYTKENNLKNTFILGFRKDVNELINISDVVVSLSYREGLPKNLLEGLILGKGILVSDIRGSRELVLVGGNGYKVNLKKDNDLIYKVIMLIRQGEEEKEIAEQKSKMIFNRYCLEKILVKIKTIY